MTYKELCKTLDDTLGALYWPLIGKIYKIYNPEFIIECAKKMVHIKRKISPKNKTIYLCGICRNKAQPKNLIDNFDLFNKNDLKI